MTTKMKWGLGLGVLGIVVLAFFTLNNTAVDPNSLTTGPANSGVVQGQDIPAVTGYVSDNANLLSDTDEASLTKKLEQFKNSGKGEIAVLTVKTLNGLSIEEFAIRVAEKWKVGYAGADNGIIFIIASDERKVRIEVGRGAAVTDAQAGAVLDNDMIPSLKRADWAGALNLGVDAIIKLLNK